MSLNVKAAMMVCMAFIVGVSYIVGNAEPGERQIPSPLTASAAEVSPRQLLSELGDGHEWLDAPLGWSQQFARMSPIDVERTRSRDRAHRIEVVTPPVAERLGDEAVRLPPIVRAEETPAVAEAVIDERIETAEIESTPAVAMSPQPVGDEVLTPAVRGESALLREARAALDVDAMRVAHEGSTAAVLKGPTNYEVKKGDSLAKISRQIWRTEFEPGIQRLLEANPGIAKRGGKIYAGEVLIVPSGEATAAAHASPKKPPTKGKKPEATKREPKKPVKHGARVASAHG